MTLEEYSFGIIPLQKKGSTWYVLLVKLHSGNHWSFPKGHSCLGEAPWETAKRELFEETGLVPINHLFKEVILEESYEIQRLSQPIKKFVSYFIAQVEGELTIQPEEILDAQWVSLQEAHKLLTYENSRHIAIQVQNLIG